MHGWHGSERVDVVSLHPNGLCVITADAVEESILRGKKTRWHTWVEDKDAEGEKIGKSHGAANGCKSCMRWCYIVPERDESIRKSVSQR